MSGPIRVVIADDHAMLREGVRHVLADTEGLEVVAEVGEGVAALEAIETLRPEVALLDLTMPDLGGLEITKRIRKSCPETRVVILSMHSDAASVSSALAAGAIAYLLKDEAGPGELRAAVRAAAAGEGYATPSVAGILADALRTEPQTAGSDERLAALTDRERDVLLGIAEGLSNKQLAARLGIGRRTVESHRESLMRKLDIRTVAGLTQFAIETGLVRIGPS